MNVTVPMSSNNFRISWGSMAPVALSVGAGLVLSPAFTFGTFMKTRRSTLIAALLTFAWAFIQWRLAWADYFWNPEIGAMFEAASDRVYGPAFSYAFAAAAVQTASCLAAGRIARWLFDHHKQAAAPLAVATAAFGLVLFGHWNASSAHVEYARGQGGESGRIEVIAESWKVANAVITDLAQTDREKMLVGYAQRLTVKRGAGVNAPTLRFDEYISSLADACTGNGGEDAICSNRTLDDIRETQKPLNFQR